MKTKILAEFGLSLCISLCSLFVVAVPTAHAAHADWSGGFQLLTHNPFVTMAATVTASSLLIFIARHYNKVNSK